MHPPLSSLTITGPYLSIAMPGTGLPDIHGTHRHIGVDFRAAVGTPVYAPAGGVVTASYTAPSGNQIIELRVGKYLWRFLHLSKREVTTGQKVTAGQQIALSGNSGGVEPHLHMDVRKDGTDWDASLANFVDPMQFFTQITTASAVKETKEMLTRTGAEVLHRFLLGESPSEYTLENRVGKMTFDEAYADIKKQDRYKQHVADVNKAKTLVNSHLVQEMR